MVVTVQYAAKLLDADVDQESGILVFIALRWGPFGREVRALDPDRPFTGIRSLARTLPAVEPGGGRPRPCTALTVG